MRRVCFRKSLTIFALAAVFFPAALSLYAADKEHVVKSGETVYALARRYGVKPEEILFLNGLEDANKIKAGQKLRIPSEDTMAPPLNGGKAASKTVLIDYTAVNGDTLYGIARKFGIPYQALVDANRDKLKEKEVLKVGQTLKVPQERALLAGGGAAAAAPPPGLPADKMAPPIGSRTAAGTGIAAGAPAAAPAKPGTRTPAATAVKPPASTAVKPPLSPSAKKTERAVDLRLTWPVKIKEAAYMTGKLDGVVLTGDKSALVQSVSSGTVVSAGPYRGFGRVAIIQSETGYIYVYGGCESLSVNAGQQVAAGSEVGRLGIDGVSQKPQLFFMVYNGSKAIDPAKAPRT